MATGPNFAPPLPLMQPPACRLLDPPNSPPIDPFLADRLRNHRHLAIAPSVTLKKAAGLCGLPHSLVWCLRNNYTFVALKLAWGEARGRECIRSDTRPTEQRSPRPISAQDAALYGSQDGRRYGREPRVKHVPAAPHCVSHCASLSSGIQASSS